jgi:hypothetical protein
MSFVFNTYSTTTPDLQSSVFYAHLVSANPLGTEVNPSSLSISTGTGYAPKPISSSFVTIDSETDAWYINTIDFLSLVYTSDITGIVIIKQVGSAIDINQDLNFLFLDLVNEFNSPITLSPGSHRILSQGSNNPPALYIKASYEYVAGDYVGGPVYPDLNMLIITGANQRDPFVGLQPQQNSSTQIFYAPLNGVNFKTGTYNDVINAASNVVNTNVTIQPCTSIYGYSKAAYFDGTSKLVYSDTGDFNIGNNVFNAPHQRTVISFVFYPEVANIEQVLIDCNAGSPTDWSIKIGADNKIRTFIGQLGSNFHITTNSIILNTWNSLTMYQTGAGTLGVSLNNTLTSAGLATSVTGSSFALGGRLDSGNTTTGSDFTGFIAFLSKCNGNNAHNGVTAFFPGAASWNNNYAQYWNYNPITTTTDITTPSVFAPSTAYLTRSFHANTPPRISTTVLTAVGNGNSLNINNPLTNWFYDFGLGKAKIGELTFLFDNNNNGDTVGQIAFASTNMVIQIWACNSLPSNTPSLSNLTNTSLWDVYNVPTTWGNSLGRLQISNISTSGIYRISKILTNITKYYRFYRIGFVNTTSASASGGSIINLRDLQLTNSSIIYPAQYILGPTSNHIP